MFEALTGHCGVWGTSRSMPPTSRRTARPAAQKEGLHPGHRHLARRPDLQAPRTDGRQGPAARAAGLGRQYQRHDHGGSADRGGRTLRPADRRQRLMTPTAIRAARRGRTRRKAVIPSTASRRGPHPLRPRRLSRPQPRRAPLVAGSRTGGESPPDTTSSPETSSQAPSSPPQSSTGAIKSGP